MSAYYFIVPIYDIIKPSAIKFHYGFRSDCDAHLWGTIFRDVTVPRELAAYSETISPAKLPLAEAHRGDPSENLHIRSYHTYSRAHVRLFDAIILNCVRRFSGTESRAISAESSHRTPPRLHPPQSDLGGILSRVVRSFRSCIMCVHNIIHAYNR